MYKKIMDNFINILSENYEIIKIKYSRETDLEYSFIINEINSGKDLKTLQNRLVTFYKIRLPKEQTTKLLNLVELNKNEIKNTQNIIEVFKMYYKKFMEITGRSEVSFTSKLLNLYNKKVPLYDSRVIKYLNNLGLPDENIDLNRYESLFNIYKHFMENEYMKNLLQKLKMDVYYGKNIKYIDENKIFDTLMYSIGDIKGLEKLKIIIE